MNRLLQIGFEPAGHWLLDGPKLKLELTRHASQKNILYAFVCDGQVMYVGKTIRPLAQRMAGYKSPGKTQSTNINNHRRIREQLEANVAVEIFALPDNGRLHYGQFHLNLAAALEDSIIRTIAPSWNGGALEPMESITDDSAAAQAAVHAVPANAILRLTLQPTYYRSGFFNIGVGGQSQLGADGETIELYLGDAPEPILGTINRRANSNGTPRIMGGTSLRDWFAASFEPMAEVEIDVYSPTSIRLRSASQQ